MEQQIVATALENLQRVARIQATWAAKKPLDGALKLTFDGLAYSFAVEVKQELRMHQLSQVEGSFRRHEHFMLVAWRIFPKIKEALRQKGIPYLEANGNVFVKKNGLFLFVDTQKPLKAKKATSNRAFTKTGLKVLFHLLQDKEAINLTQRELAEKTEVGLGTIPQVIEGLKETGFLIPLHKGTYIWQNRKALLQRWITDYATVLRPKLAKGRYRLKGSWQDMIFENQPTVWGGEPAADLLTNHLRPEKFLIYTLENRLDLIRNYRLMPDENGEVEVLDMFWKQQEGTTAPPLLVYADLMWAGGKRNEETAAKIYHEYIRSNL
jgi:hypothetical protein